MRWIKVLLTIVAAVVAVAGGLITITAIAAAVLVLWVVQRWLGLLPPRKSATAGGPHPKQAASRTHRDKSVDVIDIAATEIPAETQDR